MAWLFSTLTDALIRLLGLPARRDDSISHRDILALTEAGHQAGVVAAGEHEVIANVFELDTRTVETVMTTRERIVFFVLDEEEAQIRSRIAVAPHSTYLVCEGGWTAWPAMWTRPTCSSACCAARPWGWAAIQAWSRRC